MAIIEIHAGCPTSNILPGGCYGPKGQYYTIFGTELRHLTAHLFVAIFIGLVLLSILFVLNKKEKIKLSMTLIVLIPIVSTIIIFFLLAYLFPMRVMY
jgi:hypothetical protein